MNKMCLKLIFLIVFWPIFFALADRYPKKILSAYMLTHSAEKLCLTIFKDSGTNDASDACRHFVWSALLYKKFGLNFSQKILNAHEDNPKQPQEQKNMDLSNNLLGLAIAVTLQK